MTNMTVNIGAPHRAKSRKSLFALAFNALGVAAQRRKLADLDDALLRDIGVSRHEALAESRKPLWDVPTGWTC